MHGMRGTPWSDFAGALNGMRTVERLVLEGLGRCMGSGARQGGTMETSSYKGRIVGLCHAPDPHHSGQTEGPQKAKPWYGKLQPRPFTPNPTVWCLREQVQLPSRMPLEGWRATG